MDVESRLFENVLSFTSSKRKGLLDLNREFYLHRRKVSDNEVRKIVLSYLVHNCFKETAETFIACSDMKRTADCSVDIDKRKHALPAESRYFLDEITSTIQLLIFYQMEGCFVVSANPFAVSAVLESSLISEVQRLNNEIEHRKSSPYLTCRMCQVSLTYCLLIFGTIYNHVVDGNVLIAIELANQLAVDLLASNPDLHFDLLTVHFVELVRAKDCASALEFAQGELRPFGKQQDRYREKLQDCMALLAYEEPQSSPLFHYLTDDYRQTVADALNSAVLAHANLPSYTSMERLLQHTTVVRQRLHQELGKDGPPTFTLKTFLRS